jgi:hypothetical protein
MRVVCEQVVYSTYCIGERVGVFAVFVVVDQQWESSIKSIRQKQKAVMCSLE